MFAFAFALMTAAPSPLPPKLAALVERAQSDPAGLAAEMKSQFKSTQIPEGWGGSGLATSLPRASATYPIVVTHGMGDSCFNPGMKDITKQSGQHAGVYATCIPTGNNDIEDTINGFLLNMDKSVDVFAAKVRADPQLAKGFNAFGLSQGNNLIHGYQLKYNDPPVISFISICGINGGVGAFPDCGPEAPIIGGVCEALSEVLGPAANLEITQSVLFQANYYRGPTTLNASDYKANNQLAQWNGEGSSVNTTWKTNFLKTQSSTWVKGNMDTVVWPRESEQWGQPDPVDPYKNPAVPMNQTTWWKSDAFGLRTATDMKRTSFESFNGEHIRMTEAELYSWIDKYFK